MLFYAYVETATLALLAPTALPTLGDLSLPFWYADAKKRSSLS